MTKGDTFVYNDWYAVDIYPVTAAVPDITTEPVFHESISTNCGSHGRAKASHIPCDTG